MQTAGPGRRTETEAASAPPPQLAGEPADRPSGGPDLKTKLGLLVLGVLGVGVVLGALLGLVAALVNPTGDSTQSGPPPTVDPEGGIPPAPEAGGVVGSSDGGPYGFTDVTSFDPQGDGEENDDQTRPSWDGDPDTGWTTEAYDSPDFGGLKDGVGLVYDLGAPLPVGRVIVQVGDPIGLELYASDVLPESLDGAEQVAEAAPGPETVELSPDGRVARYWVVWVDELPDDGVGSLNEVTFVP